MKKRRTLAVVLAAAMTAGMLVGCTGGGVKTEQTAAPTAETAKQEEKTEAESGATEAAKEAENIVWAGWSGEEEASKDIFQRMMDTYRKDTGNEVTWVGWTWADTAQQLLIRTQGGEQLDIAQVDIGIFNTVANAGVLADLNGDGRGLPQGEFPGVRPGCGKYRRKAVWDALEHGQHQHGLQPHHFKGSGLGERAGDHGGV